MAKIVIQNVSGLDGSYDLDLSRFTHGELRIIKQEAGVRAGEVEDAMRAGDSDLLVALALIALRRAGREVSSERLWEAEAGTMQLDLTDELAEDDAGPPEPATASEGSGNGNPQSSSTSTNNGGEANLATSTQPATGAPV